MSESLVAGVDGCRSGWVVAVAPVAGGPAELQVAATFTDVAALVRDGRVQHVAVDMPIGLPDHGSRACDHQARRLAGSRRASVFPAPGRALLGSGSWHEANERSRSLLGRGLSHQCFNLLARIAEVDACLDAALQARIFEAHPEVTLAAMAGRPMAHAKRTPAGRAERGAVLRDVALLPERVGTAGLRGAAADDILDACALVWTARRRARAGHLCLGDGARDGRGLVMEIVV